MTLDKNGAIISTYNGAELKSDVGPEYMVMWDTDGMPVHIKRGIVDSLYNALHTQPTI